MSLLTELRWINNGGYYKYFAPTERNLRGPSFAIKTESN